MGFVCSSACPVAVAKMTGSHETLTSSHLIQSFLPQSSLDVI